MSGFCIFFSFCPDNCRILRYQPKVKFNQNICFLESVSAASSVLMCTEEVQYCPRNSSLLVKLHFGLISLSGVINVVCLYYDVYRSILCYVTFLICLEWVKKIS